MSASFSRLMDKDLVSGTETWFHFDAETEVCTIETRRNVEELLEDNKAVFNHFDERARWGDDLNRVASIPDFIYYDLVAKGITRDKKAMRAWLNDPDNRAFRTRPGRV